MSIHLILGCTVRRTLYVVQCTLYTIRRTLYVVHCTSYTVRRAVYVVHCTSYTVRCAVYAVHCTSYTVGRTLYVVHRTPCSVRRTLYGVQCITYYIVSYNHVNICNRVYLGHFIGIHREYIYYSIMVLISIFVNYCYD